MVLGWTQSLIEMSTRNISWGVKAAGTWGSAYHLLVQCLDILNLLDSQGIALPFICNVDKETKYTVDRKRGLLCLLVLIFVQANPNQGVPLEHKMNAESLLKVSA